MQDMQEELDRHRAMARSCVTQTRSQTAAADTETPVCSVCVFHHARWRALFQQFINGLHSDGVCPAAVRPLVGRVACTCTCTSRDPRPSPSSLAASQIQELVLDVLHGTRLWRMLFELNTDGSLSQAQESVMRLTQALVQDNLQYFRDEKTSKGTQIRVKQQYELQCPWDMLPYVVGAKAKHLRVIEREYKCRLYLKAKKGRRQLEDEASRLLQQRGLVPVTVISPGVGTGRQAFDVLQEHATRVVRKRKEHQQRVYSYHQYRDAVNSTRSTATALLLNLQYNFKESRENKRFLDHKHHGKHQKKRANELMIRAPALSNVLATCKSDEDSSTEDTEPQGACAPLREHARLVGARCRNCACAYKPNAQNGVCRYHPGFTTDGTWTCCAQEVLRAEPVIEDHSLHGCAHGRHLFRSARGTHRTERKSSHAHPDTPLLSSKPIRVGQSRTHAIST